MTHAYAPYSKFPVGVAGLVDDGRVVTGCNVENASYGLGLCAECGMVSDLARTGGGRLVAVACVGGDGQPLMPCGRCRQLLWEHGGADMLIETVSLGIVPMREVLPDAFGPEDLVGRRREGPCPGAGWRLRRDRRHPRQAGRRPALARADPLGDRRLHRRRGRRRADERAAHGDLLPRHVAGRARRLDAGDDRLR